MATFDPRADLTPALPSRLPQALPGLAVALDAPSLEPLEPILDALHGMPVLIKVGLSLFTAVGPAVVHHLRSAGFEVFLDLKLCDIPHQVAIAVESAARLGVALLTVHACGGREMLLAAQQAAQGRVGVLGVTVLTSLTDRDLHETGHRLDMAAVVAQRLELVHACGLAGAVLSPHELALAAYLPPTFLRVTPGIRLAAGIRGGQGTSLAHGTDDQQRTATAARALRDGADLLVVGRPILHAPDPRQAVLELLEQIDLVR